jgi:hypothetical protein
MPVVGLLQRNCLPAGRCGWTDVGRGVSPQKLRFLAYRWHRPPKPILNPGKSGATRWLTLEVYLTVLDGLGAGGVTLRQLESEM